VNSSDAEFQGVARQRARGSSAAAMAPTSAPLLAPHRKPRWTPTDQQKGILETVFAADSFPSFALRKQLAEQLAIEPRQVQIWFQNRRQRERLKGSAVAQPPPPPDAGAAPFPFQCRHCTPA